LASRSRRCRATSGLRDEDELEAWRVANGASHAPRGEVMVTLDLFVPQDLARAVSQWWGPDGRAWLSALPELLARAEVRWSIRIGRAYSPGGATAFVAPGVQPDGTAMVVKIAFPHLEARHEADALALYDGDGAVRLIADEPDDHVLVLEQCQPGCPLADAGLDDQLAVATGLLRRLWKPVPLDAPFESLADLTADWADLVDQRWEELRPAWDRAVVVEGATLLREHRLSQPGSCCIRTSTPATSWPLAENLGS
jgi:streptomycin 6-kinase